MTLTYVRVTGGVPLRYKYQKINQFQHYVLEWLLASVYKVCATQHPYNLPSYQRYLGSSRFVRDLRHVLSCLFNPEFTRLVNALIIASLPRILVTCVFSIYLRIGYIYFSP